MKVLIHFLYLIQKNLILEDRLSLNITKNTTLRIIKRIRKFLNRKNDFYMINIVMAKHYNISSIISNSSESSVSELGALRRYKHALK